MQSNPVIANYIKDNIQQYSKKHLPTSLRTHLSLKSHVISLVQRVLKFFVMLCTIFQNNLTTEMDVTGNGDFEKL